jgi:hypothetical protein
MGGCAILLAVIFDLSLNSVMAMSSRLQLTVHAVKTNATGQWIQQKEIFLFARILPQLRDVFRAITGNCCQWSTL